MTAPASMIASTRLVVPSLRKFATSQWLASPMMTCSRRYFSVTAWGSSRVLMIGRFKVVSRPTSVSKKSARCDNWKPGRCDSVPMPTLPEPQITWRDTKNGMSPFTMSANGVSRRIR